MIKIDTITEICGKTGVITDHPLYRGCVIITNGPRKIATVKSHQCFSEMSLALADAKELRESILHF